MRINSVPDIKCFCKNKKVLFVQSMVRHFVRHSVYFFPHTQCLLHVYAYVFELNILVVLDEKQI